MRLRVATPISVMAIYFTSCAEPVMMQLWYSKNQYESPYNRIMVMGLIHDTGIRANVEDEFAIEGYKEGLVADNSLEMFPPELGKPMEDTDHAIERLRNKNYEAILTITLFDIETIE